MEKQMKFYRVNEGCADQLKTTGQVLYWSEKCDWKNDGLYRAHTKKEALYLAKNYDKKIIEPGNQNFVGQVIVCIQADEYTLHSLKKLG
jgi:hypothetical protein